MGGRLMPKSLARSSRNMQQIRRCCIVIKHLPNDLSLTEQLELLPIDLLCQHNFLTLTKARPKKICRHCGLYEAEIEDWDQKSSEEKSMINHRLSGRKFRIKQILMIKKKRFYRDSGDDVQVKDMFDN